MLANTFVPTDGMPAGLRDVANWNPVSCLVSACRELFGNPGAAARHTTWALGHPITASLLWAIGLIAIFAPLATHRYRTAGR